MRWYRGDLGVTLNGSTVSTWSDQSGVGNHLTQASASSQPTFNAANSNFSNQPTLDLDGSNDWMSGGASYAEPNTIVVCARNSGSGSAYHVLCDGSGSNLRLMRVEITSQQLIVYGGSSLGDGTWTTNSKHSVAGVFNGASSSVRMDSVTTSGASGAGASTGFTLGAAGGGAGSIPWQGSIAEVLMYNRALSTTELDRIFSYLTGRYGA